MKILSLAFKNINSLKGENHIDFEAPPFSGNTLFAITGPTGSGKSSILDVISLALFNQVPRLGKISKKEIKEKGAILTRNQKEAFARVTYQTSAGRFSSSWSIEVNRNGNLNDYHMEISSLQENSLLALKKSEVPAKNEELIGLNYDQFIKSVLLAQGDFAKFLSAKKEERGELLEKITGTGIYRQLGMLAFERHKAETREIEQQQQEISLLKSYLLPEEALKELSQDLEEKTGKTKGLDAELQLLEKQLELKAAILSQEKEVEELVREDSKLEQALANFENQHGEHLKQHEKVQPVAEELRTWKTGREELERLKQNLQKITEELTENKQSSSDLLQRVAAFTHLEITAENLSQQLQDFAERIRKFQEEKNRLLDNYESNHSVLLSETRELGVSFSKNDPASGKQELQSLHAAIAEKIRHLTTHLKEIDLKDPVSAKNDLKNRLEKSRAAAQFSEKNLQQKEKISLLQEEQKTFNTELENLPPTIKEEESKLVLLKKELESLQLKKEKQLLTAELEDLRRRLKNGEPCPLCGAESHPFSEHLPEIEDNLTREISEKTTEIEVLSEKLTNAKSRLSHVKELSQKHNKEIQDTQTLIKDNSNKFNNNFPDIELHDMTNWEERVQELTSQLEFLENYEAARTKLLAIERGIPILTRQEKILHEGKILQKQLSEQYSGKNISKDSQQLLEAWNAVQQNKQYLKKSLKEQQAQFKTKEKELEDLRKKLKVWVQKEGFETLEAAFIAVLPANNYLDLKKQKDALLKDKSIASTKMGTLKNQLNRLKERESKKTITELTKAQSEKQLAFQELQTKCEELRRKKENNQDNLKRLARLKEQIEEKEKKTKHWRLLDTLIGDSKGKKFNDFAQDLTLSQLIYLANIRLKDLSERYKIDKAIAGEDDGLIAIDEDMGGQRRSVKTLSGGETFLLSLSLALALSDLASRSVEIDSLFIDEGFGTLDPETLDQTLDTLEKLQAESGKTIGIISHVASLKERISTQIHLTRNGQGYSSLIVK